MKRNLRELTTGKVGSARAKAIKTLASKWGVSPKEAKVKQAWIIAKNALTTKKIKKTIPKKLYYSM